MNFKLFDNNVYLKIYKELILGGHQSHSNAQPIIVILLW